MKRIAFLAVGLFAVVLWLVGGCCVRDIAKSMIFPGGPIPFPSREWMTAHGAELVEYRTDDGLTLTGAWVRATTPGGFKHRPVVVFFHGNGESAAQNLPFARELAALGVDVFLAEYRGYGGGPGEPSEDGLYRDGVAALQAVDLALRAGRGSAPDPGLAGVARLVLVGRSLGTGVAVELARRGHGTALVLISPYTSMVDMGRGMAGPFAGLIIRDKFDSASKIGAIVLPVLVIHGTEDELIPTRMGQAIAAAAKRGRFIPRDGEGHNDLTGLAELIAKELAALETP